MTKSEHDEILNYSEIWYVGQFTKNNSKPQTGNEHRIMEV